MCKYCQSDNDNMFENELLDGEANVAVQVCFDKLLINASTEMDELEEEIKINYCPMCGRKLNEVV